MGERQKHHQYWRKSESIQYVFLFYIWKRSQLWRPCDNRMLSIPAVTTEDVPTASQQTAPLSSYLAGAYKQEECNQITSGFQPNYSCEHIQVWTLRKACSLRLIACSAFPALTSPSSGTNVDLAVRPKARAWCNNIPKRLCLLETTLWKPCCSSLSLAKRLLLCHLLNTTSGKQCSWWSHQYKFSQHLSFPRSVQSGALPLTRSQITSQCRAKQKIHQCGGW